MQESIEARDARWFPRSRRITYRVTFQTPDAVIDREVTVPAASINSGARKALARALGTAPEGAEFHRIEFWRAS